MVSQLTLSERRNGFLILIALSLVGLLITIGG